MSPGEFKALRESLELTQDQMAQELGLRHRSQVHHMEIGRTAITGPRRLFIETRWFDQLKKLRG